MGNDLSKFYRSFSGTDSLAFIILPNAAPVLLGSLTTVSYSMFRDKKPVPLIGKINVGGFTRGTRIYAGTMIFTMINQHWINDLLEQVPWLKNYGKIKSDELPIFDIMVMCANEYGASVQMFVYGVDITDEGQVLSVEDMFTENQFSFVARDLDTFSNDTVPKSDFKGNNTITKINPFDLQYNSALNPGAFISNRISLNRNMNYNNGNMMTGDDVLQVQYLLNKAGIPTDMTGVYDPKTYEAVKGFQSISGLPITGSISDDTFKALKGEKVDDGKLVGVVITKSGAVVYATPTASSVVVDKLNYKESIEIIGDDKDWYKYDKGYVSKAHVFTNDTKATVDFPVLREGSTGKEVVMLQEALNKVLGKNIPVTGVLDGDTAILVLEFEKAMGLPTDGIVDKQDWIALQEKANGILVGHVKSDNYDIEIISTPRKSKHDLENFKFEDEGILCKDIAGDGTVKVSAIAYYDNNKGKIYTTTVQLKAGQEDIKIDPSLLQDAFLYNGEHKSLPRQTEFIIMPTGKESIKWSYEFN